MTDKDAQWLLPWVTHGNRILGGKQALLCQYPGLHLLFEEKPLWWYQCLFRNPGWSCSCSDFTYVFVCLFSSACPSKSADVILFLKKCYSLNNQRENKSEVFSLIDICWYVKGVIQQFPFFNIYTFFLNVAHSAAALKKWRSLQIKSKRGGGSREGGGYLGQGGNKT